MRWRIKLKSLLGLTFFSMFFLLASYPSSQIFFPFQETKKMPPALLRLAEQPAISLKHDWYLQSSYCAKEGGRIISSSSFRPKGWVKTNLPTTVLAALVRQGVYPEPTIGLNNLKIPDANEAYSEKYNLAQFSHLPGKRNPWKDPYWFWTRFKIPASLRDQHLWLNLSGINYRAEVWLNGRLIADSKEVAGMFGSWSFDITNDVRHAQNNTLAIKIFPLDHPGLPAAPQLRTFGPFGENGGPTGDIGQNVTMQSSVGWDWIPEVRDRNIGIWQPVTISATGPVDIRNPVVVTELQPTAAAKTLLPVAAPTGANLATLIIKAELRNLEPQKITGILIARIRPENFSSEQKRNVSGNNKPDVLINGPAGISYRQPQAFMASNHEQELSIPCLPIDLRPFFSLFSEPKVNSNFKANLNPYLCSIAYSLSNVYPAFNPKLDFKAVRLPEEEIYLKKEIELAPLETRPIILDETEWPQLRLEEPKLWWPAGMGFPHLYQLELSFVPDKKVSTAKRIRFGIREVSSQVTEVNGWRRRDFFINGQKVFLRGGAWVPEMLLRREADPDWLRQELLLWRQANLNLVRIWGGGVTPPEEFFALTDELGLLVWHDFWITGDCQATWGKGSRDWPLEAKVFLHNAQNTVLRLQPHPSLFLWTAGNEGYPRQEIYQPLRDNIVAKLDGTRPFLPSSGYAEPPEDWGLSWPDNQPSGTYSGGPYYWIDPKEYYNLIDRGRDWLFKNEVGLPSLPLLSSLKKFIPDWRPSSDLPFPLNHAWGFHDACEGNGKYSLYDRAIRQRYGEPRSLVDYVWKAQLVNAENYRAVFEAANQALDRVAGVILWKTNSAWPSVMWQLYDYYLQPNAAYYFVRRACEPLHPQLDLRDSTIRVINQLSQRSVGLVLVAELYSLAGQKVWSREERIEVEAKSAKKLWPLPLKEGRLSNLLGPKIVESSTPKALSQKEKVRYELKESALAEKRSHQAESDNILFCVLKLFKKDSWPEAEENSDRDKLSALRELAAVPISSTQSKGKQIAENFYWLAPNDDFRGLENLPPLKLRATMEEISLLDDNRPLDKHKHAEKKFRIKIHNPNQAIAFFIHLTFEEDNGKKIPDNLGLFSDNFFSLLPGEKKVVTLNYYGTALKPVKPSCRLEGWNIVPEKVRIKAD